MREMIEEGFIAFIRAPIPPVEGDGFLHPLACPMGHLSGSLEWLAS